MTAPHLPLALACATLVGPLRAQEPVLEVQLLDNGAFAETVAAGAEGAERVPWWRADRGADQVVRVDGRVALGTLGAVRARQPLAAFAPLAGDVRLVGVVRGPGELRLRDGAGHALTVAYTPRGETQELRFELRLREAHQLAELPAAAGVRVSGDLAAFTAPVPRLVLELGSSSDAEVAYWSDLAAYVPLPCPDEAALEAELVARLDAIFALWRAHVLDPETGYACYAHDVVTGERLGVRDGQLSPAHEVLLRATSLHADPAWSAPLERFLETWFAQGFHPDTGLPRAWDVEANAPRDERPLEIHAVLDFLLDLADHGPERWRAEALARLRRIGEHVLAHGAMPDGQVAAGYVPGTGEPVLNYSQLRRFDVCAPLARLGALDGDARYLRLAREAVGEFEYTWTWPGTWEAIDPGFDDDYGHYGDRALQMSRAWPDDPVLRRVVRGGYDHYAPLWRDALRLGGNVAADQVRGWLIFAGLAELEPALAKDVAPLLAAAQRVHFKGEQYENGAWGDVTIFGFDPKAGLQVGDLPGMPQNLLQGLASNYASGLTDRAETRAMFTAVMRSSEEHYRQPYGYLVTRAARKGANPGGGSLRFAVPLVDMLEALAEARR
ncbi:MAG: hypothetical protein H6828_01830 [Planctomycetes bacterium]|nr:hypothetical protein [Planctomycetota bacterium]